jgi:hypothetical protein
MNTPTAVETRSGLFIDLADPDPATILTTDIFWALSRQPRFGGASTCEEIYTVAQHSVLAAHLVYNLLFSGSILEDAPVYPSGGNTVTGELWMRFRQFVMYKVGEGRADHVETIKTMELFTALTQGAHEPKLRVVLEGLRHDWAEGYLIDLPTPVKRYQGVRAAYEELEQKVMGAINARYDLDVITPHLPIMDIMVKWADDQALAIEAAQFIPSGGIGWMVWSKPLPPDLTVEMEVWDGVWDQVEARRQLTELNGHLMRQYHA